MVRWHGSAFAAGAFALAACGGSGEQVTGGAGGNGGQPSTSIAATTGTNGGGGNGASGGATACVPKPCKEMGLDCGKVADGCGGLVDCGTCTKPGEFCGGGETANTCGIGTSACAPLACADRHANCGPVSDGCGKLTADCGTCDTDACCGCGETPSACAPKPAACVPKTCADLGTNCGPASDGCGGLTNDCGTCGDGVCCGCGSEPNKCGGGSVCTPLTCSSFPVGTCGQQSDGCGGLTANCETCTAPDYCGGGGPDQCGHVSSCVNLQCKQVTCMVGATTSISGTVYDPAGKNPLPNVNVYVPNGSVDPINDGAACNVCDTGITGNPLVSTITDANGKFTLTNMPVDANVPVIIQLGKWRRQLTVTTQSCGNVALTINQVRLPRNKSEGNIPKIALSTGGYDSLECLLRKIGIDDAEFTNPNGTGRVNLYSGSPTSLDSNGLEAAFEYDDGTQFPLSTTLWDTQAHLQAYDVTLLSCEGSTHTETKIAPDLAAMFRYVNNGGRVFASHYQSYWVAGNTNGTGTGRWSSLFNVSTSYDLVSATNGAFSVSETVVQTFPKGSTLANWLVTVGGSTTLGTVQVNDSKHSLFAFDASRVLEWVYSTKGANCTAEAADGSCETWTNVAHATQYLTFNAPVEAAADSQCGRFVFSEIHVASDVPGGDFPSGCTSTTMTAQEKALEYMFFDLASAVCDNTQPPPACTKITCADQGIQCGPAPDGCGGSIANCGACTGNQVCGVGGTCGVSACPAKSCGDLGHDCGQWSDSCGGTLDCGSCTAPQSCGGGGTPGSCGAASCRAETCASLNHDCGHWSDGCGATLDCGACSGRDTCGGGGVPGTCGEACTPRSCAELGVACGPSSDGCGNMIDCGACPPNACVPLACGGRCGLQGDGCGNVVSCPDCPHGACAPTTCKKAGATCGAFPDGCGSELDCGSCSANEVCTQNRCTTAP